jgi:Leucine-rich repeat (LRR) protein
VSPQGFGLIPPSPDLQLLDLTRLRIGNEAIRRLIPEPSSLEQLTLEGTAIDGGLSDWLRKAKKLRELDLSGTPVDDSAIDAVADAAGLETLWMTQTNVSDQALEKIVKMRALQSVDLQRTRVTDEGIRRLRMSRPRLEINPLKILQ